MDLSKLAQDVLAFAGETGNLGADLADAEKQLRDVLGQIGQLALQSYADRDQKRGYEGSSRVCVCGQDQKFVGHRPRTLETLFGSLTITRAYYHCAHCHSGFVPFDQAQGIGSRHVSVPLAQVIVEMAESLPFRQSQAKLEVLLGRALSASSIQRIAEKVGARAALIEQEAAAQVKKDRSAVPAMEAGRLYILADGAMVHRVDGWQETKALQCRWQDAEGQWHARRLCRNEKVPDFDSLAWACMHVCGLDNARQTILCGDGIAWIWNHLGPIADEAVQILDWYHAREHLATLAKALHGEGTPACKKTLATLESLLWNSQHEQLVTHLETEKKRVRGVSKRAAIDELLGYHQAHRARMDYKKYREWGLQIGSGAIEGDCKNIIHARMKRGSPRWSDQGSQAILSLRCCHANDERVVLWHHKPLMAA